jgi:hypothetical protein
MRQRITVPGGIAMRQQGGTTGRRVVRVREVLCKATPAARRRARAASVLLSSAATPPPNSQQVGAADRSVTSPALRAWSMRRRTSSSLSGSVAKITRSLTVGAVLSAWTWCASKQGGV